MSTFYFAPDTDLKSISIAAWKGNLPAIFPWYKSDGWYLNASGVLAELPISGTVSGYGYSSAISDGASGIYAAQQRVIYGLTLAASGEPSLAHLASGGGIATSGIPLQVTTGITTVSGLVYIVGVGNIQVEGGTPIEIVNPWLSSPTLDLGAIGNTLYTCLPNASGIGALTLTGSGSGVATTILTPMTTPAMLVCSGEVAVGGWSAASLASGYNVLAIEPSLYLQMVGLNTAGGIIDVYTSDASGDWSLTQTITSGVAGNPVNGAWSPNDEWFFDCDQSGGKVRIFKNIFGTLTASGSIAMTTPTAVAITTDSDNGLVAQGAANQLTALAFSGNWTASGMVTMTNPQSVICTAATKAAVGFSSGVAYLGLANGVWVVTASAALPFTPTSLQADASGNIYAAGTQGGSGYLSILEGTTVAASGFWAGSAVSLLYVQGQAIVIDSVANLARLFGLVGSNLVQQSTTAIAPTGQSIAMGNPDIFISSTSTTAQLKFGAPFTLVPQNRGEVSIYNPATSGWASANLGVSGVPTALAWDPSGNVTAVTQQNYMYTISPSGVVLSSGLIAQITGVQPNVPLGISSLLWLGNNLYAASSMNDSLIKIQ